MKRFLVNASNLLRKRNPTTMSARSTTPHDTRDDYPATTKSSQKHHKSHDHWDQDNPHSLLEPLLSSSHVVPDERTDIAHTTRLAISFPTSLFDERINLRPFVNTGFILVYLVLLGIYAVVGIYYLVPNAKDEDDGNGGPTGGTKGGILHDLLYRSSSTLVYLLIPPTLLIPIYVAVLTRAPRTTLIISAVILPFISTILPIALFIQNLVSLVKWKDDTSTKRGYLSTWTEYVVVLVLAGLSLVYVVPLAFRIRRIPSFSPMTPPPLVTPLLILPFHFLVSALFLLPLPSIIISHPFLLILHIATLAWTHSFLSYLVKAIVSSVVSETSFYRTSSSVASYKSLRIQLRHSGPLLAFSLLSLLRVPISFLVSLTLGPLLRFIPSLIRRILPSLPSISLGATYSALYGTSVVDSMVGITKVLAKTRFSGNDQPIAITELVMQSIAFVSGSLGFVVTYWLNLGVQSEGESSTLMKAYAFIPALVGGYLSYAIAHYWAGVVAAWVDAGWLVSAIRKLNGVDSDDDSEVS